MAASKAKLKVVSSRPLATEVIQSMSQAYLECRDWGHSWSAMTTNVKEDKRHGVYHEWVVCPRCTTTKHRVISTTGELLASTYMYPEGYLIPHFGAMPKNVRADIRLALVKILVEK